MKSLIYLPNCIGATVTRSNIVDDNDIPRSEAIPHVSLDISCHFKLTRLAICSEHNFSGRSTSDELYVPLYTIPHSSITHICNNNDDENG